jgi:hypothetical protein
MGETWETEMKRESGSKWVILREMRWRKMGVRGRWGHVGDVEHRWKKGAEKGEINNLTSAIGYAS